MDYLKYLKESDTPIGRGEKSSDSPVEYLEILENIDKPKLFVPLNVESPVVRKRTVPDNHIDYLKILSEQEKPEPSIKKRPTIETQQYLEELHHEGRVHYVEQAEQLHPDRVHEYLQSFIKMEEDEEPPTGPNQVQEPDNKQLTEKNIQLEIKTLKNQMESLNKRYGTVGGGGGTNAVQYANGGTMNGNLTVNGTLLVTSISASSYLGVSAAGGDYVRRTGDIMTGTLNVPTISAITYQGLPSYDNRYVELSGDRMTGTLFTPSVSALSLSAHIYDLVPDGIPTWREGRIYYDTNDHTLALYTDIQGVTLQVGQEQWIRVVNKTNNTIFNGTPVFIDGAQGNRPTIQKASAINQNQSRIIGLTTHNITDNATGVITVQGLVRDVNTLPWSEGTILYTSLTAGVLTDVRPLAPYHGTEVGIVVYQHGTQGIIYVHPQFGEELANIHDVIISNPVNGQYLSYIETLSSWTNVSSNRRVSRHVTSYTALTSDNIISFTLTAAATCYLPSITSFPNLNLEYIIKNKAQSTAGLTISAYTGATIDNEPFYTILPSESITIVYDGDEWIII